MAERVPTITAIAGTNGAGKSSIVGEFIRAHGGAWYDPDETARKLRAKFPQLERNEANGLAWTLGKEGLEAAIAKRRNYAFETTLGGSTIPMLLSVAARQGFRVTVWYVGLVSVELHIRRVKARVKRGGHDIAEDKIRERYVRSLENLVGLVPELNELKLFDNSRTVAIAAGEAPAMRALLHYRGGRIVDCADPRSMPDWAKPVVMAVLRAAGSPDILEDG